MLMLNKRKRYNSNYIIMVYKHNLKWFKNKPVYLVNTFVVIFYNGCINTETIHQEKYWW